MARLVVAVLVVAFGATGAAALCTANTGGAPVACRDDTPHRPRFRITRDDYGVPHIKARSPYDVGFAVGRAQAEDRLLQLEFVRKSATGNVAEIVGRDFLSSDEDTRRQFYTEEERDYFVSTLPCELRAMLRGFVDGINAYVDEIYADPTLARVPHEFFFLPTVIRLQGNGQIPSGVRYSVVDLGGVEVYRPDAWRTGDVAAVGALLAGRFGSGGGRQLRQAALLAYLEQWFASHGAPSGQSAAEAAADVFADVRWLDDPNAPTTIPATGAINPVRGKGHTPTPIADADGTRWLADLQELLAPPAAVAAAPEPRRAQLDFVRGLSPHTIAVGLEAAERMHREAQDLHRRFGVFLKSGSNAWVVAPERTVDGNALLWGGPQEGLDNPSINWEAYVRSSRITAGGMMIAGVPGVLIGQTERFAFTTTSGEIDNSTLYVETLQQPAAPEPQAPDASYAVLLDGTYRPMDRRVEVFHWAGEDSSKPAAYAPHGPALNDGPLAFNVFRVHDCDPAHFHGYVLAFDLTASPPRAFTYKTAYWKNEVSTVAGFLGFEFARDFDGFAADVDRVVSLHNFFYADRSGNIAYWSAGARPAFPPGFDDRLPADGSGSQEWGTFPDGSRYVPFSRSLVAVNPTQGWLANWNTKPAEKPYIQEGNSHDEHWGEIYRSQRIGFLLQQMSHMTLHDVEEIERDVGSMDGSTDTVRAAAPYLIPLIRESYDRLVAAGSPLVDPASHPTLATALDVLEGWNAYLQDPAAFLHRGHYRADYSPSHGQPGMSIFYQWWYATKAKLWGRSTSPGGAFLGAVDFADRSVDGNDYLDETTYNMFLHVARPAQSGVPQTFRGDYFGGHRDEILIEGLNDAIAQLAGTDPLPRRDYGLCNGDRATVDGFGDPDPHHWGWQPEQDLDFDCLDDFANPLLALGTQPTAFGRAPSENRSTYMQALEAGAVVTGENVMPPGQSGWIHQLQDGSGVADPHMGDQAEPFRTYTYKPMRLRFP